MVAQDKLYSIQHLSVYTYSTERVSCVMLLCLKPRANPNQRLEAFDLVVEPLTQAIEFEDFLGNSCHLLNIHRPHEKLAIRSKSLVSVQSRNDRDIGSHSSWRRKELGGYAELWDYQQATGFTAWNKEVEAFLKDQGIAKSSDLHSSLSELEGGIHKALRYVPRSTSIDTTIDRVLQQGEGVCQDFAHLMISVARHWGVPSRYVMGYLCPSETLLAPAQESHAWVECLLPDSGWVAFDPTNPGIQGTEYIAVAYGRDYKDVTPTKGLNMGTGNEHLEVEVNVDLCGADRLS